MSKSPPPLSFTQRIDYDLSDISGPLLIRLQAAAGKEMPFKRL